MINDDDLEDLETHISEGRTLRSWCRANDVSSQTVYRAINRSEVWQERIARARELGYDAIAEECLAIADDVAHDSDAIAAAKLQVHTRQQLLSKWSPKYSDRQRIEHAGDASQPVVIVTGVPQPEKKPDLSMFGDTED